MPFFRSKKIFILIVIVVVAGFATLFISSHASRVDYNTQIKPIFNKKCIACHGGVKQQSGFSLLFREEALGSTKSGKKAIIPGNASGSELIKRITSHDAEERMPYQHEPLSKEEIDLLKKWINEGAEWGTHWAYVPIKNEPVPDISSDWAVNDIDKFILQKLDEHKLKPSPEADKATLLRRVSLDITGLPPSENVAKKYLNDASPKAYENLVDSLIASNAYGEKWALLWMDLARYADTKGYEADRGRNIWKYRDWLINSFNHDMPYNEFLTEQLAGDLMPDADDSKYIATAFHRNSMTNDEGGTDNEEFRTAAVIDRTNTTWTALMGTSFGCVQCHSHPYDPFKHDEYYNFLAFFNNSRDEDTNDEYPFLRDYDSAGKKKLDSLMTWLKTNAPGDQTKSIYTFLRTGQPAINAWLCDEFTNGFMTSSMTFLRKNGSCRLPDVELSNKEQIIFRYSTNKKDGEWKIYEDSLKGKLIASISLKDTKGAWEIGTTAIPSVTGKHHLYFSFYNPIIKDTNETGVTFDWFQFGNSFPGKEKIGYEIASQQFNELIKAKVQTTPIMVENNNDLFRASHVFERGNWRVKGKEVTPDVPGIMNPMPAAAPKNRLGLAMWITDKKNPLTSRTMVNRLWEQLFGHGIVETLEDFGTQGMMPTHRELLDHLSWQFMNDDNWSIKKILKEIVMSATYRQQSIAPQELIKKDPNNLYYARFSRVRLSGEQLRDQALCVSGLLSKKMFGKSVMPFQPDGIWRSPYNDDKWEQSNGEDQYRRALYTFWKRSAPYPSMITFDGASREVCLVRRIRTNTPLQALTTLNDSAFLVMSRHFAMQMQQRNKNDVKTEIKDGYQTMMYKNIPENKLDVLMGLYNESLDKFKADQKAAKDMLGEKEKNVMPETAALTVVMNTMLNLDEWLNKN